MFERFENRYDLRGRLITAAGLHIGAGGSLAVVGSDNPVMRDVNGLPYIPGSSLKGALRSLIEAMVRGIAAGSRREPWACDPLSDPCIKAAELEGKDDEEISLLVERGADNGGQACTVCRLFGSPWLASKVKVCDLYLNPANEPQTAANHEKRWQSEAPRWMGRVEVRDGVAIDRDTETAADGRKYDFEVIPRETAFDLHLRVDNASAGELGLLFLGLREFTNGDAWLGGNTSRGLGVVQIVWDEFEVVEDRTGLIAYFQHGQGRVLAEEAARQAFIVEKTRSFLETLNGEGSGNAQEAA
ncbi:MAG TPA: CRISPR-associated RAMP protein Csx7 [Alphaproteobacteria bacterium]|nr:CRISPR-associated RAMP protein Csx7 [Alphaproteobacteria bacterium]